MTPEVLTVQPLECSDSKEESQVGLGSTASYLRKCLAMDLFCIQFIRMIFIST